MDGGHHAHLLWLYVVCTYCRGVPKLRQGNKSKWVRWKQQDKFQGWRRPQNPQVPSRPMRDKSSIMVLPIMERQMETVSLEIARGCVIRSTPRADIDYGSMYVLLLCTGLPASQTAVRSQSQRVSLAVQSCTEHVRFGAINRGQESLSWPRLVQVKSLVVLVTSDAKEALDCLQSGMFPFLKSALQE